MTIYKKIIICETIKQILMIFDIYFIQFWVELDRSQI